MPTMETHVTAEHCPLPWEWREYPQEGRMVRIGCICGHWTAFYCNPSNAEWEYDFHKTVEQAKCGTLIAKRDDREARCHRLRGHEGGCERRDGCQHSRHRISPGP